MNIQEIIAKKRDGLNLTKEEIAYFVAEYTNGSIPDYQAAALIMAIYIRGLDKEETTNLTLEMAKSGEMLDLSEIGDNIVDKHSTGGVGDKITIILMPILASLGMPVVKMSGRGLGFTGGTADKLESIPGYVADIKVNDVIKNVKKIGICLATQNEKLTPADKKIYALRDAICCTASMPLIASSIMSKKIASGANKLVLDVTVGKGAFMKSKKEAVKLSKIMKEIGELSGRETICTITNMDEPVGYNVGNSLEIVESVECLKGNMPKDIQEIVTVLGSYMLKLAGMGDDLEENKLRILENIKNGKAYNKFLELVQNQNGNIEYIKNTDKFEKPKYILPVISNENGYVKDLNALIIGETSVALGAGKIKKEDKIDHAVGIVLNKKVSDKVEKGECLAYVYANDEEKGNDAVEKVREAYEFSTEQISKEPSILGIV